MEENLPLPSDVGEKKYSFRDWLVALGIPALFMSIGLFIMEYNFYVGVGIFYFSLLILIIDWWAVSRRSKRRFLGIIVGIVVAVSFAYLFLRPAPLLETIIIAGTGYSNGQVAAGITWGDAEGDIRVTVSNPTGRDYDDMDMILEVGQDQLELPQIMAINQLSTIPDVYFTAQPFPVTHLHLSVFDSKQTMQLEGMGITGGNPPSLSYLYGKDANGNPLKVPTIPNADDPSPIFRVQLNKLPAHTDLKLILAVAITNPPGPNATLPKLVFAPFHAPSCIKVSGGFKVLNRPVEIRDPCHSPAVP